MQTVINNYIVSGTVIDSAIVQGSVNTTTNVTSGGAGLLAEAVRIFSALGRKEKAFALAYLYDLEAGIALPEYREVCA